MTRRRPEAVVADALARAFLAGEWDPPAMARRGSGALGGDRRRWLLHLALAVRHEYPDAPRDRPRELARFVEACPPLTDTFGRARAARRPLPRVTRWFTAETAMAPSAPGWRVAPLGTVGDISDLLGLTPGRLAWFADNRGLERTVAGERLRHYRYRWAGKGGGGHRLIEEPKTLLKHIQRVILREVLDGIPPHPAAHGFRRGRSVLTHASAHTGADVVVRFDLEDFFPSVPAGRVFGLFRAAGYPEAVAHTLTGLVTNVVPAEVWRSAPAAAAGGDVNAHHRLGRHLATPHLPQGAPSSPALANLAAFGLDRRLAGLAATLGASYSRYADDLAFSGGRELHRRMQAITALVATIARDEGFRLNPAKTSCRPSSQRQLLAGVVNQHPNVARPDYDRLKATVHHAARTGGAGHDRASLAGRIAWVEHVHPARGARLRAEFAAIRWTTDDSGRP